MQPRETAKQGRGAVREAFRKWARRTSELVGTPGAFFAAFIVVILWGAAGPFFHYSDTWQLVMNTASSIITFLMVFVIQSSQNRDGRTVQVKLDELIKAIRDARNSRMNLDHLTDDELKKLEEDYKRLSPGQQSPVE